MSNAETTAMSSTASAAPRYDVVIVGGGLAGLCLARQLLLAGGKSILMLERLDQLPSPRQKVGEATVQVSGYYYSRVLQLEEHLMRGHYMKYALRFYWRSGGVHGDHANSRYEDIGQSYIRGLSNIATYQLDRNKIEAELLRLNLEDANFTFVPSVRDIQIDLAQEGPHRTRFTTPDGAREAASEWVVDASGRARLLARRLGLTRKNQIRHGTSFFWVDGLLNIEHLTDQSMDEIRKHPSRQKLGHLPVLMATNHFCGDGFWFWVIPLHGRTSLGLVYDVEKVPREAVATPEKLVEWVCKEFPLFAHDLPKRKIVDWGGYRDFSYDCAQTIAANRWALVGEAGRFTDPLYSPGGDLISVYCTLISDAILGAPEDMSWKAGMYEQVMRAVYDAYVPSFSISYEVLGDQEAYSLKYTWELAIYFAFYVFPFINDFFTNRAFLPAFFVSFRRLGPLNQALQVLIRDYYRWKREHCEPAAKPRYFDFMELGPLRHAERTFYEVGIDLDRARAVLADQLASLEEFARFIVAHVAASVAGQPELIENAAFVEALDPLRTTFDAAEFRRLAAACAAETRRHMWSFDPHVAMQLRDPLRASAASGEMTSATR